MPWSWLWSAYYIIIMIMLIIIIIINICLVLSPLSHNPLATVSQTPDSALKNVPKEHISRVHEHPMSVEWHWSKWVQLYGSKQDELPPHSVKQPAEKKCKSRTKYVDPGKVVLKNVKMIIKFQPVQRIRYCWVIIDHYKNDLLSVYIL